MLVIAPDPARRIDLPGVGPTPRPVDIDQAVTGFSDLVSLRIYDFAAGPPIEGEAEADEVLVTLLSGAATFAALAPDDAEAASFELSETGDRVAYLPPHHRYRLTPRGVARVAYARARPTGAAAPAAFAAPGGRLALDAPAERLRLRLVPLSPLDDAPADLGLRAERLAHLTGGATVRAAGETQVLDAGFTVALAPGEAADVKGEGLMLLVGAAAP